MPGKSVVGPRRPCISVWSCMPTRSFLIGGFSQEVFGEDYIRLHPTHSHLPVTAMRGARRALPARFVPLTLENRDFTRYLVASNNDSITSRLQPRLDFVGGHHEPKRNICRFCWESFARRRNFRPSSRIRGDASHGGRHLGRS